MTLGYAGSRGINLMQVRDGNPTVPQTLSDGRKFWTGNDPRINPNWSAIEFHTASGSSWYNAFQFGLNKRWSKGLQFQSSYPCSPEFFNIFNHPNFAMNNAFRSVFAGAVTGEVPLPTAGVITWTGSARSRQIQFALKLLF